MTGILNVSPVAVNLSALTQAVISGEIAAGTAAGASALAGTTPMAPATDPAEFAAALNAAGAAYLGAAAEHVGQRGAYAGAQDLAALSYLVTEALSKFTLTI